MRAIVAAPDFLKDNYLSTDARIPVTLSAHERLQPARHQRDPRQHLGQFLVRDLQDPAFGRKDHGAGPVHRGALAVPDAGRRARLHPRALARQHLVDRAVPRQQSARAVLRRPLGRRPDEDLQRLDRTAAVAGEARARTRVSTAISSARPSAATSIFPKRSVPVELQNLIGSLPANPFRKAFDQDGNFKLGPIPKGFPINLAANYQPRTDIPFGRRLPHDLAFTRLAFDATRNWPSLDLNGDDASMLSWASRAAPAVPDVAEVPGLRRQPRPLFRNGRVQQHGQSQRRREGLRQGIAAQRRRQARPDRIHQDFLTMVEAEGETFDYIVVGSGAGGGTVAARLAEAGMKVLVLEAGADPAELEAEGLPQDYDVPAFHPFASENEAMAWNFRVHDFGGRRQAAAGPGRRWTQRRPLSTSLHARRLHRAQRNDPHGSAGFRLERHRGHHGRYVMARRKHAAILSAHRELPPSSALEAIFARHRRPLQSDRAWVERMARHGTAATAAGFRRSPADVRHSRRDQGRSFRRTEGPPQARGEGARACLRAAGARRRGRGRSERPTFAGAARRRPDCHSAVDVSRATTWNARAGAGCGRRSSLARRVRRARDEGPFRQAATGDRRRVPQGQESLPSMSPTPAARRACFAVLLREGR